MLMKNLKIRKRVAFQIERFTLKKQKYGMQKIHNLKLNLENRCWAPRQHSNLFSYPYLDIY